MKHLKHLLLAFALAFAALGARAQSLTDYAENKIVDALLRGQSLGAPATWYVGLMTASCSDSSAGTEVTQATSGYTRVASTFVTAGVTTAGRTVNSSAISFATVAGGATITVVGWGIIDTATFGSGNLLYWATVTDTSLNVGDQATFPAGNLVVTED